MSKHTLTLTFETTKELLEFTSKHLNPQIEITSAPVKSPVLDAIVADALNAPEEPKKARAKKVKVEEAAPAADLAVEGDNPTNGEEVEGARATAETEAAAESKAKTAEKKVEKAADEAEPEVLDYKTHVRQHAMALLKKPDGQERMFKIYDEFGVTAATEITVKQLPAFRDALIKAMEE